jgi:sulfoxide reductase heme-binding subunit YedZ
VARAPLRKVLLRWLKPATFVACLIPLLKIPFDAFLGPGLGANPIEEVLNRLGFWTLTLLTITLACTPAKILFKVTWPVRIRRMLGVFTFVYAVLHFGVYLGLDQAFDLKAILEDITKRKFITFGFIALVLMAPLALTSTNGAVRRLGFPRWKLLHRLVYIVAALGLIHFVWRVKADLTKPLTFIAIVGGLMGIRIAGWVLARRRRTPMPVTARASRPGPRRPHEPV